MHRKTSCAKSRPFYQASSCQFTPKAQNHIFDKSKRIRNSTSIQYIWRLRDHEHRFNSLIKSNLRWTLFRFRRYVSKSRKYLSMKIPFWCQNKAIRHGIHIGPSSRYHRYIFNSVQLICSSSLKWPSRDPFYSQKSTQIMERRSFYFSFWRVSTHLPDTTELIQ